MANRELPVASRLQAALLALALGAMTWAFWVSGPARSTLPSA